MGRPHLIITLSILFIYSISFAADIEVQEPGRLNLDGDFRGPEIPADICQVSHACNNPTVYFQWMPAGTEAASYYDPAAQCQGNYPFKVDSFWATFLSPCCVQWPFQIDVIIFEPRRSGNPCEGPGREIYRNSFQVFQQAFEYPAVGRLIFPEPICIDGPVFVGLLYSDQPTGRYPSMVMGDGQICPSDDCDHWTYFGGHWHEWNEYWQGEVSAPTYWITGEFDSPECAERLDVPTLSEWGVIIMFLLFAALLTIAEGKSAAGRAVIRRDRSTC